LGLQGIFVLKIGDEEGEIGKVRHVRVIEQAKIDSDYDRSWTSEIEGLVFRVAIQLRS
jgi:hypothetical protein